MVKQVFKSFSAAVRYALENTDIGTQSSRQALVNISMQFLDTNPLGWDSTETYWQDKNGWVYLGNKYIYSKEIAGQVRSKFRAEKGLTGEDCRTYATQPRRNMLADNKIHIKELNKMKKIVKNQKDMNMIENFLKLVHSKEHAQTAIKHLKSMCVEDCYVEMK